MPFDKSVGKALLFFKWIILIIFNNMDVDRFQQGPDLCRLFLTQHYIRSVTGSYGLFSSVLCWFLVLFFGWFCSVCCGYFWFLFVCLF